jgi:RNA-directed DNA polymerase
MGRTLQRLMRRRRAHLVERVRRVTQVHQGKDTPGVDPIVVTTPEARAALGLTLSQRDLHQVQPVRRVYRPTRPGTRPLGLPTIVARGVPAMGQNALEPFWEARVEGWSSGVRPGRGGPEALQNRFALGRSKPTRPWVVAAAMDGAFENIGHAALVQALGNFPARGVITQGRKAG